MLIRDINHLFFSILPHKFTKIKHTGIENFIKITKHNSKSQSRRRIMFKKIITPVDELNYRVDGIDNKYLINEGNRALGLFAATTGTIVPTQISQQDVFFYVMEGVFNLKIDDRMFELKTGELILVPKTSSFTVSFPENAKILTARL